MKQRDEYIVDEKVHNPRRVNIVCDATFYGKSKNKLGTLVFKDIESKEILIWKHIETVVFQDYRYLKEELLEFGYIIQSMTLDEIIVNNITGEFHYTHPRIRTAYRSLRTNLPNLFTYKNHKKLNIQNTTNSLEAGVFSHMKNKISLHRSLSKKMKLKLVDYYLVNYQKK